MAFLAVWRLVRNGTPERSVRQIGRAVLDALEFSGCIDRIEGIELLVRPDIFAAVSSVALSSPRLVTIVSEIKSVEGDEGVNLTV